MDKKDNRPSESSITEKPIEQIDSFDTLMDIGMIDHPPTETFSDMTALSKPPETTIDSFQSFEAPTEIATPPEDLPPQAPPPSPLENIREYSETTLHLSTEAEIHYPFHFYAQGKFGYYERDKLLRFITENPVGITSAEIDLQIQSGRVLIPRISEYAGIKLVQELRDSPLQLKLSPSSRDQDETREHLAPIHVQYDVNGLVQKSTKTNLLVLDTNSPDRSSYQEFDQMQASQFLKAEMVEAEKSELFQELVARMIDSLKIKAQLKGAEAITQPVTQILSLRLPSQYQVVLTTSLLKRKVNA